MWPDQHILSTVVVLSLVAVAVAFYVIGRGAR